MSCCLCSTRVVQRKRRQYQDGDPASRKPNERRADSIMPCLVWHFVLVSDAAPLQCQCQHHYRVSSELTCSSSRVCRTGLGRLRPSMTPKAPHGCPIVTQSPASDPDPKSQSEAKFSLACKWHRKPVVATVGLVPGSRNQDSLVYFIDIIDICYLSATASESVLG